MKPPAALVNLLTKYVVPPLGGPSARFRPDRLKAGQHTIWNAAKVLITCLAFGATLRAQVSSSQNYAITVSSMDGGGQKSASIDYAQDMVITPLAGRTVATFSVAMVLGFGAQLNTPPQAADDVRSHLKDAAVDIPAASLFINDFDPDGDTLSLASADQASSAGGTVSVSGQTIRYTPPVGLTGLDHFQYVVTDSNGDIATATVTMAIGSPPGDQPLNTLSVTKQADGQLLLRFRQQVGFGEYVIEFTHDLNNPTWQVLANQQAGANGTVEVLINPADATQTFFRAVAF